MDFLQKLVCWLFGHEIIHRWEPHLHRMLCMACKLEHVCELCQGAENRPSAALCPGDL